MTDAQETKRRIHPEMLVGISAVVIGLCALGVSMYETSLMREEQRAAVMPILELGRSYNYSESDPTKNRYSLLAHNVGIGPARVIDFTVTVDDEPQPTWDAMLQTLTGGEQRIAHSMSVINGRTIPPDRRVEIFELKDKAHIEKLLADDVRIGFEACYCSIFDECWTTSSSDFGASEPVAACKRSDASFRE